MATQLEKYLVPEFFYSKFKDGKAISNRQKFHRIVLKYDIESIQIPHSRSKLYSLKDWNERVPAELKIEA